MYMITKMQYAKEAIKYADKSMCRDYKHGAVCVIGGRIASSGTNVSSEPHLIRVKNLDIKYGHSIHAEINAILKATQQC